ncbi:MAG: hypothetical protein Q9218_008192, partial [Villophora microphyllina]
ISPYTVESGAQPDPTDPLTGALLKANNIEITEQSTIVNKPEHKKVIANLHSIARGTNNRQAGDQVQRRRRGLRLLGYLQRKVRYLCTISGKDMRYGVGKESGAEVNQGMSPPTLGTVDQPSTMPSKEDTAPQAEEPLEMTQQSQQGDHGTTLASKPPDLPVSSHFGHEEATKGKAIATSGREIPHMKPEMENSERQQESSHAILFTQELLEDKSCQESGASTAGAATQSAMNGNPGEDLDQAPSADTHTQPDDQKFKRQFRMAIHVAKDEIRQRLACLDTGADVNVISVDVVDSLGLRRETYKGPPLMPLGSPVIPEWQVTFDWHVANKGKTYTSTFAVLDGSLSGDFDILLGEEEIRDIGFYKVNNKIWFHSAYSEVCVLEATDVESKKSEPSI